MIQVNHGFAGWFKIEAVNCETGQRRVLADWFPNLILNSGLDMVGTLGGVDNCYGCCQVGSSSTTPNVAQTALVSFVAGTSSRTVLTDSFSVSPPYYGYRQVRYRFNAGVAAGNLSEVAVAPNTTGATFNRALILDSGGLPTTITVLSNEFLDITYELRLYPNTDDVVFSTNISGQAHDCVLRPAVVTSILWAPQVSASFVLDAYNGALGDVTASPSGTSSSASGIVDTYSAGSLTREGYATFGLSAGNLAGGISAVAFGPSFGFVGRYQCSFDPPIAKDNTNELYLRFSSTWSRYTI